MLIQMKMIQLMARMMQINMIYSFEPIVSDNCKVLLLGTMPGVESLRKQQYYSYKYNVFWRIIYALFSREPDEKYENRKTFLLDHDIAVWDVLMACEREGSSDSDIKQPVPNDFISLYQQYPNIRSVCFNGGPACRLYSRFVNKKGEIDTSHTFYTLPSTSPAYTINFEKKLEQWRLLLQLIR